MSAIFKPVPPRPLERHLAKLMEQKWCPPRQSPGPCNCIGPQGGQPVCPCQMRGVTVENGRYVQRIDLGPAP